MNKTNMVQRYLKYTRGDKIRENEFNSHRIHKQFPDTERTSKPRKWNFLRLLFFFFNRKIRKVPENIRKRKSP